MSRYIDADILSDALRRLTLGETDAARATMKITHYVSRMPTADVRENVRGEWLHDEVTMNGNTVYTPNAKCSICDCYVFQESNFCPNCGADMRGDKP